MVLGDDDSDKTSLVARLQGVEAAQKGCGLEYHYIDVKDAERDGKFPVFFYHLSF